MSPRAACFCHVCCTLGARGGRFATYTTGGNPVCVCPLLRGEENTSFRDGQLLDSPWIFLRLFVLKEESKAVSELNLGLTWPGGQRRL